MAGVAGHPRSLTSKNVVRPRCFTAVIGHDSCRASSASMSGPASVSVTVWRSALREVRGTPGQYAPLSRRLRGPRRRRLRRDPADSTRGSDQLERTQHSGGIPRPTRPLSLLPVGPCRRVPARAEDFSCHSCITERPYRDTSSKSRWKVMLHHRLAASSENPDFRRAARSSRRLT